MSENQEGDASPVSMRSLKRLATEEVRGPLPSFTILHIIRAIDVLGTKGPVGRQKLSDSLMIGEGATRTIVNRLRREKLLKVSKKEGCGLTPKGEKLYRKLKRVLPRMSPVELKHLSLGAYNYGILVRRRGRKLRTGLEQRDAAIRAGAAGAVTLTLRNGELIMPGVCSVTKDHPDFAEEVIASFNPRESDVVVIAGSKTREGAEYGGIAAAWTMIEKATAD